MKVLRFVLFVVVVLFFNSCFVSKKKYEALDQKRIHQIDSVNALLAQAINDFNAQRTDIASQNTQKNYIIDSLSKEIKQLTADKSDLKNQLKQAIDDYNREKQKLIRLSQKTEKHAAELDTLRKILAEKQKKLADLEKMINHNKKIINKLETIVRKRYANYDTSQIKISKHNGKVFVTYSAGLLFKPANTKPEPNGISAIKQLIPVLEVNKNIKITVEGHTDSVGNYLSNWYLSVKRAVAIVDVLQQNSNIDPKRITASGRGMYAPVAPNDTKENRAKNRRITIILEPEIDEFYKLLNE